MDPTPPHSDAGLVRLHPFSLILGFGRMIRAWALPLLVIFLTKRGSPGALEANARIAAWIAGAGLILAFARWTVTRYGIVGDRLVVRSGILVRRLRTIPIDQIQNVDLSSGPVERAFGVCRVKVETAGGTGAEADLAVVGRDAAAGLRERLLAHAAAFRGAADHGVDRAEDAPLVVRRMPWGELLLLGATSTRFAPVIAALAGTFDAMNQGGIDVGERIRRPLEELVGRGPVSAVLAGSATVLVFVFAGWLISIALTVLRYFGFTVRREGDGLRVQHGLLTRTEALLRMDRIQLILRQDNPLRRALGRTSLHVQTASSRRKDDATGSTILSPLLPDDRVKDLVEVLFPDADVDEARLRPVHPLALRRGFIRCALPVLLGAVALCFAESWWSGLALASCGLPAAYLIARARYRVLGYALSNDYLMTRAGLWTRRLWLVPKRSVQTALLVQSPLQRRLGLATVIVDTAGATALSTTRIVDLGAAEARSTFENLVEAAARVPWGGGVRRARASRALGARA